MTTPPNNGDTNWGTELNAYLVNTLQADETQTSTTLNGHIANSPPDPHGDRAYALSLMAPIQKFVNLAKGFLQLDITGAFPYGVWTDFRPCGPHFTSTNDGIHYPPQWIIGMDGHVKFTGQVIIVDADYNSEYIFVNPLPSNCRPNMMWTRTCSHESGAAGILQIYPTGYLQFFGFPAGLAVGTAISIDCQWPLDAHYDLLQG